MSVPKENVLVNDFSQNVLKLTLSLSTAGFLSAMTLASVFEGFESSFRGLGEPPKGWLAAVSTLARAPKFFAASSLFFYGLAALSISVSSQTSPLVSTFLFIIVTIPSLAAACRGFVA
ncbi:hypothetical protein DXG01_016839 [Tephrocybe rancida]|nr:hypothetical protein DXG01_016839 [Tephrocybe rancida]